MPNRYVYYGLGIPLGVPNGAEHMLSLGEGGWRGVGERGERRMSMCVCMRMYVSVSILKQQREEKKKRKRKMWNKS